MKTIYLLVSLVILTSCSKEELVTPTTTPNHQVSITSTFYLKDSLNLSLKIPQLNIQIQNLKPSDIRELVEANVNTHQNEVYGYLIEFEENGNLYQFVYYLSSNSITSGMGRIDTHPYILNLEPSTINLCNWYQNVPITYDIFSSNTLSR